MTPDVEMIPPDLPVAAIARLLADRHISAVPVVDADGALLGIVSEADLIRRIASRLDKPPSWFTTLVADPVAAADRYSRTHGFVAREVMTANVVTVTPETPVAEVAALMEQYGIRRVLVMEDGRLRGLVSRADLLRALVAPTTEATEVSDELIRRAVVAKMRREPWADTSHTVVEVKDGVVEFHGFSTSEAAQRGLHVLAEQVPGVKGVADRTQPLPQYFYAEYT
ncbi:CBS domain-containing protein [Siccirubricoccus sp. G192]|nr:CBS domain-containing protein [Siccirubricoccus sp. G192]